MDTAATTTPAPSLDERVATMVGRYVTMHGRRPSEAQVAKMRRSLAKGTSFVPRSV